MRTVLRAAGVYNVLWGAWAILFPAHFWSIVGMEQPNYPFLWQCIGMIVGVYGVGYWVAGNDPLRHWPIVLVGLLGKIFGPIGFLQAWLVDGAVPARFGLTILTNDLAWWAPFGLILARAYAAAEFDRRGRLMSTPPVTTPAVQQALRAARSSGGRTLEEIADAGPALVVFLRHGGCTFCREALADLASQRARLARVGITPVLVHMDPPEKDAQTAERFARYGLADAPRIADPARELYRAFELKRGRLSQLFGWRVWLRGVRAGLIDRHFVGPLAGDGTQMPGAFLVHRGRIVRAFRHDDAADRPDYCELAGA